MKTGLIKLCFGLGLLACTSLTMAQSDSYFATGEDLDYLIESDNMLAIQEIEYKLRQFKIYRSFEDFVLALTDEYVEESSD